MNKPAKTFTCCKCGNTKKRKYRGGSAYNPQTFVAMPVCKLCSVKLPTAVPAQ